MINLLKKLFGISERKPCCTNGPSFLRRDKDAKWVYKVCFECGHSKKVAPTVYHTGSVFHPGTWRITKENLQAVPYWVTGDTYHRYQREQLRRLTGRRV